MNIINLTKFDAVKYVLMRPLGGLNRHSYWTKVSSYARMLQ